MQRQIFNPRPVVLPDGKVRREPTRPFALRPPGFEEEFDYRTLLFDSFFCGEDQVLVTGSSSLLMTLIGQSGRNNSFSAKAGPSFQR